MLEALNKRRRPKGRKFSNLADSSAISRVTDWVSTQCSPLDIIIGGGIPVGRMTEIYGDTSTGKTLLGLHILAETQAMGGVAVMLDTETAVSMEVAEAVGLDLKDLIYTNPDVVEDVFADIMDVIQVKQEVDPEGIMTILWDSVAATSSDAEVAKVMKEGLSTGYPPTAREISQMMRVVKRLVAGNRIALVMLNQTREKINVLFGNSVSTFGGKAIGFYSSVRIALAQTGKIKDRGEVVGITARAYVAKNKVAPPFGQCSFPILFDIGVDDAGAVLAWLKREKIVRVRGAWTYLTLPGDEEVQFQRPDWPDIYDEHREIILEMMYSPEEDYDED